MIQGWLPASAALVPGVGYSATPRYITAPWDHLGGLEVVSNEAYTVTGTNVLRLSLATTNAPAVFGATPAPSVGASYVAMRAGAIHLAYVEKYGFTEPYRYGRVAGGTFELHGTLAGIYDGAVDNDGNLYVLAYPDDFAGSRVYRYDPASTSLVQVIFVGGYSGGIAFDHAGRLHVAEQDHGEILRFTPGQLAGGNLTAQDGQVVARVLASYLCFDHHDRLYAVSGYGNEIGLYDPVTTNKLRTIAIDNASGYGIGWIKWNRDRRSLYAVYTDYYVHGDSTLFELTFATDSNGIPHDSPLIRNWIDAYTNFHRPNPASGGFAQDNDFEPATPGGAIIGKPASFTSEDVTAHVVSLGDGGSITLMFRDVIVNGPGPDFAVFENGFSLGRDTYAELAFVEVATTTNAWARFPVTYFATNTSSEFATVLNARQVDGFAGKHRIDVGTPFDLAWLARHTNVLSGAVDLQRIQFVRMVDVIGNGTLTDSYGNPLYDPAGTEIYAGFDLRGVGVINSAGLGVVAHDGAPAMTMMTQAGRSYQMEYSLNGRDWFAHGVPFSSTGGVHQATLPDNLDAAMFRIEQVIPFTP